MKKTLAIFSLVFIAPIFFVSAYTSPGRPVGRLSDFGVMFTPSQREVIESAIDNYARPAGLEMAVVTIPSLGGDTIENYAVKLFEEWGIGDALKDNGILILIARDEREVRIEVGYGLESSLTDAHASAIIRTVMVPAFKEENYVAGVLGAIGEIEKVINQDPSAVTPSSSVSTRFPVDGETVVTVLLVLMVQILPLMMYSKSWWLGGVVGFVLGFVIWSLYAGIVFAVIGLIIDYLLSKKYGGKRPTGTGIGGMFFGRGLGGRGGGGGFGGFGGGMSGGGGASGRW